MSGDVSNDGRRGVAAAGRFVTLDDVGDLPMSPGRVFIEASAGTGKTFTVTHAVARHLLDGDIDPRRVVMLTFTRNAAAEMRDRIRAVLRQAAIDGSQRAVDVLADFDGLTATTIHAFCSQILAMSGLRSRLDSAVLEGTTEDTALRAAVADVLVNAAIDDDGSGTALPTVSKLTKSAALRLRYPRAPLVPSGGTVTTDAERWSALTDQVAKLVRHRSRTLSYDELLQHTERLVSTDAELRLAVQRRFSVIVVDEFQDTDPAQWSILDQLFPADSPDHRLLVVGDPKQAIYAFRGGDLHTYSRALTTTDRRFRLAKNFRSSPAVIDGLNYLFDGYVFGDDSSDAAAGYEDVSPGGTVECITVVGAGAAVELRCPDPASMEMTPAGRKIDARAAGLSIRVDLVRRIDQLLRLDGGPTPGHVSVLTRTNGQAVEVVDALSVAGIPAVLSGSRLVTQSVAMVAWRSLLWALARPADERRCRLLALSDFGRETVASLAVAADAQVAEWQSRCADMESVLRRRGARAMYERLRRLTNFEAGMALTPAGRRFLTDADHVTELLEVATGGAGVEPGVALSALDAMANSVVADDADDRFVCRTEGDAMAVQVLTMHKAKGLEYDYVFVPFAAQAVQSLVPFTYVARGSDSRGVDAMRTEIVLDANAEIKEAVTSQAVAEAARVTYVALTRARHKVVCWWNPAVDPAKSGLGNLLFRHDPDAAPAEHLVTLRERWHRSGSGIDVVGFDPGRRRMVASDAGASTVVSPQASVSAPLPPVEDQHRGRWSFSAIVAGRGPANHGEGSSDEPAPADTAGPGSAGSRVPVERSLPTGAAEGAAVLFPYEVAGTGIGTAVHYAFESVDFTAVDLGPAFAQHLREKAGETPAVITQVATAVSAAVHTPLGAHLGVAPLDSVPPVDRLNEMDFEFAIPGDGVTVAEIIDVVAAHPASPELHRWCASARSTLGSHHGDDLSGLLVGSIDLVMRRVHDATPKFHVIDYKTNRLESVESVGLDAYRPDRLWGAMADHVYPLQATLYAVALHRYLSRRLPGYDPSEHLGACGYLFVRGMVGGDTPTDANGAPFGVCSWPIPVAAVVALSALFAGREVA